MLSAPRSRAQQIIYQRRAKEEQLSKLQTKLKQDFHQQEFANGKGKIKQQLERLRAESARNLILRRQRLAELLNAEEKLFQQQILDSQETPQQTRERMAQRLQELKTEKEERRQADVQNKLEKRFQQNADELRKVDQDLKELKTAYERNIQMVERQAILQQQYEEEMLFAELSRREQAKKEEQEREKRYRHQEKVEERNAILGIQKEMKYRKVEEEKELNSLQKQMLKEEWEKQTELERFKEQQSHLRVQEANRSIQEENQRQKRLKEETIRLEKQRDREMIERVVAKERELAEYEKQMKDREREEAKKILSGFKNKNVQLAAYQKELDRLIQQERLKKQKKEEELWSKREQARINLLYDVYQDRERKVREHQSQKQVDSKLREQDRIQVERRVKEHEEEQERRRQEEYAKNKREQERLLEEITKKQERRRMLLLALNQEEEEMEKARKDYDRKIMERKERGKQQLETFKQTNRLF